MVGAYCGVTFSVGRRGGSLSFGPISLSLVVKFGSYLEYLLALAWGDLDNLLSYINHYVVIVKVLAGRKQDQHSMAWSDRRCGPLGRQLCVCGPMT
jgi:hypothetical protein